jgi:hypothetical protein
MPIRTFTFTSSSRCALTGCAGPARRRSTWPIAQPVLVLEAGGAMVRFDGTPFRLDSQEVLATNGLLTKEILGFFIDMFAGREIEPVPTAAEFAARRLARQ